MKVVSTRFISYSHLTLALLSGSFPSLVSVRFLRLSQQCSDVTLAAGNLPFGGYLYTEIIKRYRSAPRPAVSQ